MRPLTAFMCAVLAACSTLGILYAFEILESDPLAPLWAFLDQLRGLLP